MRDVHDTPTCLRRVLEQMTSTNFRSELRLGCTRNDARPLYVALVSNSEHCGYRHAAESLEAECVQSIALQCLQRTKRKLPHPMRASHRGTSASTANRWLPTDSSSFRLFFWRLNILPNISCFFCVFFCVCECDVYWNIEPSTWPN